MVSKVWFGHIKFGTSAPAVVALQHLNSRFKYIDGQTRDPIMCGAAFESADRHDDRQHTGIQQQLSGAAVCLQQQTTSLQVPSALVLTCETSSKLALRDQHRASYNSWGVQQRTGSCTRQAAA